MKKSIDEILNEFVSFSITTFSEATNLSSLTKLKEQELPELEEKINEIDFTPIHDISEEYADCIMCLIDSAARTGIDIESIRCALSRKLIINKNRKWIKSQDNTYSHVK